ncbi:MAG: wax ester/triacylglycerol synthase family O-acyltransferase [Roseateles sp.]|uniref:WS/DGAT/MGAT family O-acyltransferase n=1 Tax=Roseateles sp. TaxID=1971397 RepID=UPI0039EBD35F
MNHLSGIDASFLHFETPETPMHVASLLLLDLPEGYDGDFYEDVKAMIRDRLHLATVLNRKLAPMPFELAEPVWIDDDDIDIDHHVRSLTLRRPGTMEQLDTLIARLHSTLLDRSRPLWEMYVIEGLENGQVAFYSKAHHSGVDGKAGTELAKVMYDTTPEVRKVRPPARKRGGGNYQLGMAELLGAAVSNTARQYRKLAGLLPTAVKALGAAGQVIASQRTAKGERAINLGLAPKAMFNVPITNQRSFTTMSVPFDDLKQLGKRVGGTVNTIVMAMCSTALRRFMKERGLLPKEALIAAVPVSLRAEGDDSMNNQVSMVRVDLATDIDDPAERFKAIHTSSEAAKAVVRELKPVLGVDVPVTGAPWFLTSMASLYGRSNLPRSVPPLANVLISNVPGPPVPLYVCGARMAHFYPVSIPYHGSALNITVQSYAGSLDFGVTACRRILSQEESYELIGHLRAALREIERLPGVDAPAPAEAAPPPAAGKPKPKPASAAPRKPRAAAQPGPAPAPAPAPARKAAAKKPAAKRTGGAARART